MIKYCLLTGLKLIWLISIIVTYAIMLNVTGWSAWFDQRHLIALILSPALLCALIFFIKNSIFNNFKYLKSKKHYAFKIALILGVCCFLVFLFFLYTKYSMNATLGQDKKLKILIGVQLMLLPLFSLATLVASVCEVNLIEQNRQFSFLHKLNSVHKAILAALITTLAVVGIIIFLSRNADYFSLEIARGDLAVYSMLIKGFLETGSWFNNPNVGYPVGLRFYDFPTTDTLPWIILSIIGLFSKSWITVMASYNWLMFPLTALFALWACRHIGLKYTISISVSILYSFLYYHVSRAWGHFFLGTYFWVPLIIAVCNDIMEGKVLFAGQFLADNDKIAWNKNKNLLFAIFVALGTGLIGIYYSFFACFFFAFAGVYAWLHAKKIRHFFDAGIMISLSGLGVLASLTPHFLFWHQYGKLVSFSRNPAEAEMYGMKLSQLLLPVPGRRPAWLDKTISTLPFENENYTTALGLIAALGLLILLAYKFFNIRKKNALLERFASLNLAGILLALMGGFAIIFAIYISPQIRGYNRIVVYIAFMALAAFFIVFNNLLNKFSFFKNLKGSSIVIFIAVVLLGIHFQVPDGGSIPARDAASKIETKFITDIEKFYPDGANIFQYPVLTFLEGGGTVNMIDYDHFIPYLAGSAKLHWTYGAMRIRDDAWYQAVGQKPLPEALEMMRAKNINGIFINRNGYNDRAATLEAELIKLTGITPQVCANNDWVFFVLTQTKSTGL